METYKAAWVAGIIEGEGCIGWESTHPRIRVKMSDEDTILRLLEWTGVGRIMVEARPEGRKDLWAWTVNSADDFLSLADEIEPFLMARRTAKLQEVRQRTLDRRANWVETSLRRSESIKRSWVARRERMATGDGG